MNRLFLKPFRLPFLIRNREQERGTMESDEDKRLQDRLASWQKIFEGKRAEDFTVETVQQLRLAVAENRRRLRRPWEHLSDGTLNAMGGFSRWLSAIVAAVAAERAALALVPDLLGDDRERGEAAWIALKAAAANRAAAAEHAVEWSKPRSPTQWRQLRSEKELPDGATWWKEQRKADSQAFRGTTKSVSITRAKAIEWGLELEEFKSPN